MTCFGFDNTIIPTIRPLFGEHGRVTEMAAGYLGLSAGIPVTYKAGDQLNNAFSLGVLHPGEVAATAGTSGVIYGVSDDLFYDPQSRINSFAHVNHTKEDYRVGVLLCINGAGIFNRWIRNMAGAQHSYAALNEAAAKVPAGSQGLVMLPFGNGAERILNNRNIGAHIHHLDFNLHATPHLVRAAQEGIAFAFRYGLDIMRENGMNPSVVRAGRANMFLSPVFLEAFVNVTGVPVEMYETDGSIGAALGAAVGAGYFTGPAEAFGNRQPLARHAPDGSTTYNDLYPAWKQALGKQILKPGVSSIQPA
jgi:xylulokinase